MLCVKCKAELPAGALYCPLCGKKQASTKRTTTKRGNGQGSVYKLDSGKYKAVVTLGYYLDENGKKHRSTRSGVYITKKAAVAALPELAKAVKTINKTMTFKEAYDKWYPTHRAQKSTMNCYSAAFKHFSPLWGVPLDELDIDDLQECLDDCGKGKRTQQNMKAVCGLVYKYAIPRKAVPDNLNLAPFLIVGGEAAAHREAFTEEQLKAISKAVGVVPYADYIYSLCYTGFRPSEFLALGVESYDRDNNCLIGGAKTAAGKNRIVTISPKIQAIIDRLTDKPSGKIFCGEDGGELSNAEFTEKCFYPALDLIGIDNPVVEIAGGVKRHKYTPHSCRHTFATLMKRVDASGRDKQALIGHTTEEQLRYYQDVEIADLRCITDAI